MDAYLTSSDLIAHHRSSRNTVLKLQRIRASVSELKRVCFAEIDPRFVSAGYGYDHMQSELDMPDDYPQAYDSLGRGYPDAC